MQKVLNLKFAGRIYEFIEKCDGYYVSDNNTDGLRFILTIENDSFITCNKLPGIAGHDISPYGAMKDLESIVAKQAIKKQIIS